MIKSIRNETIYTKVSDVQFSSFADQFLSMFMTFYRVYPAKYFLSLSIYICKFKFFIIFKCFAQLLIDTLLCTIKYKNMLVKMTNMTTL